MLIHEDAFSMCCGSGFYNFEKEKQQMKLLSQVVLNCKFEGRNFPIHISVPIRSRIKIALNLDRARSRNRVAGNYLGNLPLWRKTL